MTGSDIIAELEQVGLHLWEDDGKVRFRGPEGALTPDRRDLIVSRRDDVLRALRERDSHAVLAEPDARFEPFPLTDVQSAYLLGRRDAFEYGSVPCHAYGEIVFDTLDRDRLQQAWSTVVDRHDMLRIVLDYDGFQRVLTDPPAPVIDWTDARDLAAAAGEARVTETRQRLSHETKAVTECPLYSIAVTELADRAVLHFSIDFLIADYVSIYRLLDEFGAFYENPDETLPAPAISFRDYLRAERQVRQGPTYERDRAYWLARLDELPAAPELPMVAEPSRYGATRFTRRELRLDAGTWSALKQRAGTHHLSASNAVLAAYADVLGRWSRQPRFTLDLTVLSRLPLHPDVNNIVGDFTSVELLAVDTAAADDFVGRAKALSEQLFEDLDHRLFSGVEVLRELGRRRGQQGGLMPVVFTSAIGLSDAAASANPMRTPIQHGISQTPQVWLDCQAMEHDGTLQINWDTRDDVIPSAVLDDMFATFETLLHDLADYDAPWSGNSVALPAAQLARRAEANDTARPLSTALLPDALVEAALARPDGVAIVDAGATISYRELLARATAVAAALRAVGHERGDRVGVVMDKGWHQVAAAVGILLAGGTYVPVETSQPETRRDQILTSAEIRVVLSHSANAAAVPQGCRRIDVDTLADATASPTRPQGSQGSPRDSAYVIFTSGSTGTPKGVEVSHEAAVNTLDDVCRRFAVTEDDVALGLSSLAFDLSVFDIFGVLGRGGTLVLADPDRRADPSHWAELIAAHGVTVLNTVPAQMMLLEEYVRGSGTDCTSVRLAMMSGDWIPVSLPDAIRARIPSIELASLGGATEAAIWSIGYPIGRVDPAWPSIPYGKPLANQRFHVLDSALRARPDLVAGDLYIAGAGLAEGYLGDPEKTARSFLQLPSGERAYRTGDQGRYLPDGAIEFIGRDDRQVKIRGHRVELAEVESALAADPQVNGVAVTTQGERNDRRLVAFVETAGADTPARSADPGLVDDVVAAGDEVRQGVDVTKVVEFAAMLDDAALRRMIDVLRQSGLWPTSEARHTMAEIMRTARVAPKHERLVRRWLAACTANGYLRTHDDGYTCPRLIEPDDVAQAWAEVERLMPLAHDRPELVEYFRTAADHLPELMRDEQDPLQLLFPEGDLSIQEAAYMEGFLSRYLNRLATSTVRGAARRHGGRAPLRVLEVGAGVGGTSVDTIPALDGENVRYSFTDVSQFFLNKAADRFGEYPWVDYAMFDFNEPFREQGVRPNSVDLILCGNVMHYAKDARVVLRRMREALAPGGWLVFIETTRDNYQILTSMEFLFDATAGDFQDVRHGKDQTFIARQQWHDLLTEAGADIVYTLPDPTDELAGIGMHVFTARFKQDRVAVDTEELARRLGTRLPAEMIPSRFHVLDSLPLTSNGKVDRSALAGWAQERDLESGQSRDGEEHGSSELKRAIARIYAEVLHKNDVSLDTNFYSLGGDSLLAAQVVTALREGVPEATAVLFDELLRELLNGASVQEIAMFLDDSPDDHGDTTDQAGCVLTGAVDAIGNPVHVLINDGFGPDAERIGAELGERDPVVQVPMLAVGDTLAIDDLAHEIVQEIRTLSPGPFHLIGVRGGALLALTAAQQLTELGVPVCGLTLVSSYPLPAAIHDEVIYEAMFLLGAGANPEDLGYPGQVALGRVLQALVPAGTIPAGAMAGLADHADADLRSVAPVAADLDSRPRHARVAAIAEHLGWPAEDIDAALRGTLALFNAAALHPPGIYTGDVRLLVHSEEAPVWPTMASDMRSYWKDVCVGRFDIEQIPGSHFSCTEQLTRDHIDLPEEEQ